MVMPLRAVVGSAAMSATRTLHARPVLLAGLLLVLFACGDDGRPGDGSVGDGAADSRPATDGGGVTVTGDAICAALRRCLPDLDMTACLAGVEPALERVSGFGCSAEADVANQCTTDAYIAAADTGGCESLDATACATAYDPLASCVRAAGGVVDYACDDRAGATAPQCVEYTNNVNDPEVLCGASGAEVVDTCPTDMVVGECRSSFVGTGIVTRYYQGVDPGILSAFEATCASAGGTWSVP
jgi:hypothetical protein